MLSASTGSLQSPLLAPRQASAATQPKNIGQGLAGNALGTAGACTQKGHLLTPPSLHRGAACPLASSSRGSDQAGHCAPMLLPPSAAWTTTCVQCVIIHAHNQCIPISLTVRITMTGLAYGSPLVRMPEWRTQQACGFSLNSGNDWQYMQEAKWGNAVCHPARQMGVKSLCCTEV